MDEDGWPAWTRLVGWSIGERFGRQEWEQEQEQRVDGLSRIEVVLMRSSLDQCWEAD